MFEILAILLVVQNILLAVQTIGDETESQRILLHHDVLHVVELQTHLKGVISDIGGIAFPFQLAQIGINLIGRLARIDVLQIGERQRLATGTYATT